MVFVHPSLSKDIATRSAEASRDERIADFSHGEKRSKIQFRPLKPSTIVSLFLFFLIKKCRETNVQRARVPEISSSGTYTLHRKASIIFFQSNCIFHLSIVGTRQAINRNRITEKGEARSDEVASCLTCPSVGRNEIRFLLSVVIISLKAGRK